MTRTIFLAFLALGMAKPALAELALTIPLDRADASVISASHSCAGGEPFTVRYVNSGANALALLPVDGEERIFVNTVSGSGARYVSGELVWWTKGADATLENTLEEGSLKECPAQDHPSDE